MRTLSVAEGVAWRVLHNVFTNPSLLIPSLVFPLFFFTAFAGGLSRIDQVPGFDYPPGYTAFQFVFVLLQSAAFGGVFTGFGIARDFESGFGRRLLLSAPHRSGIVARLCGRRARPLARHGCGGDGGRAARRDERRRQWDRSRRPLHAGRLPQPRGDPLGDRRRAAPADHAGRARHADARLPLLFFAPVYVPLALLQGWIHDVATYNPITRVLEAGRGFLAGSPTEVGLSFALAAALVVASGFWALRGLRSAEHAG